jgi:hypothetical protein
MLKDLWVSLNAFAKKANNFIGVGRVRRRSLLN